MKLKVRTKKDANTLIIGLIILVICLLSCIFHISDLYNAYKTRVNNEFLNQLDSAESIADKSIVFMEGRVKATCEDLLTVILNGTEEEAKTILSAHFDEHFVGLFYIKRDGTVYNRNGLSQTNIFDNIKGSLNFYKKMTTVIRPDLVLADNQEVVMVVSPVKEDNKTYGYVIGLERFTNILSGGAYQYLVDNGSCFLVESDGNIISKAEGNTLDIEFTDNDFYYNFMKYSDGGATSKMAINRMRRNMIEEEKVNESFTRSDGKKVVVVAKSIDSLDSLYLYSMYCEDDQLMDVKPLIFRSVLVCILIIMLMISLIIYVWAKGKQTNITIEKLAYEDSVTKGLNANYFRDMALQMIAANREIPYIVQRFDICNFRYINEAYGHNKADDILRACIDNLKGIFDDRELCVRMDSDQFITLNINDSQIDQKRTDYVESINEYARGIGVKYPIRLKFGVYQIRKQDTDIDLIIDRANVARKSLDGDETKLIAYYSDALVQDMRKIDKIESEMTRALETGEFKVYLQPKWDIVNNSLHGAEALVRWIKKDGSVVFPGNFIPVFERNGFIEKLDFYMLETICREIRKRLDNNLEACPVSINQSRLLLHNPEYINNVAKVLRTYNIPKRYVELELTETVFFDDRNKMIDTMNRLKRQEVKLSMDDFGSGYSSLNLLKDIPLDYLKIDREFFSEAITSETSTLILQKIIEMAEGLGMEVVCEGVETEEQIIILKKIGCRLVQGYYYSKPIPLEEFMDKYLSAKNNNG